MEPSSLGINVSEKPGRSLGRLAVATDLQGQGIGAQIMELVHGEVLDSGSLSATRLITLDADNDPQVVAFYKKLGYQESIWAEKRARESGPRRHAAPPTIKMIRDVLAG